MLVDEKEYGLMDVRMDGLTYPAVSRAVPNLAVSRGCNHREG